MPYYEFFNLPANGSPKSKVGYNGQNRNEYSEDAAPNDLWINYWLQASPDARGWSPTGPGWCNFRISRRVKTHSNEAGKRSPNIDVGDLLLYRLTIMSTLRGDDGWVCQENKREKWPKAHIELRTQVGPVQKLDLERIVIDRWSMHVEDETASQIFETMDFRAWLVAVSRKSGGTIKMELRGKA